MNIEPGLKAVARHRVAGMDLADRWGGEAAALASPILIIFIEKTCMQATDHLFEPGQMSGQCGRYAAHSENSASR